MRGEIALLQDGCLRYRLIRRKGKHRLALIHALAMDLTFWDEVVDGLGEDVDVLVYDVRGHGQSTPLSSPWSAQQHSGDLLELMDILGWQDAVVGGAPMGGCIAIAATGIDAKRIRGLGLVDTTAWYGPDALAKWAERAERAQRLGMAGLMEFQLDRWFTDGFRASNPAVIKRAKAVFLANVPQSYGQACSMLGSFDGRDILRRYPAPCSIMLGQEDYATPIEYAVSMAELARSSVLDVIEGARHFTPLEKPKAVAGNLRMLVDAAYR